jgi:predicted DNA-binding transcriptional regulator AlpA
MNTRAQWIANVPDLYDDLETARTYLTVAQVSELTGFSPTTITDLLSREPITSAINPLGALSRPAARIGTNPYYSTTQVEDCLKRRNASTDLNLGGTYTPLPKVSAEDAAARDLLSVVEIAALARVHEQTIRRWKARDAHFPPPVALRERDEDGHSGVPFVVHEGAAVRVWLRERAPRGRTTRRQSAEKAATPQPDAVAV